MKNLKKVLAFVTMITMLLSVAVSAGTLYPDVDDAASYGEAVKTLNALDIMIGDENGNFNPDASITRAEAAAIVTRMKALGEAASATGGTKFADVPADHWAAGYVNLAEQSGIINGYGDGNFGPSDPVTYEQMIKMIVAALGRTPEADTKGGYPSGYLIVASQENITNGVSVTPGAEAPRAAVARLAFNALDVNIMGIEIYKPGEEEYVVKNETLLKDYLKVIKYEGIVNETYLTAPTIDPKSDIIKMNVTKVNGYTYNASLYESEEMWEKYYEDVDAAEGIAEGDTNAASLIGKAVSAYAVMDADTDKLVLLGIAEKSGRNQELVLDETQIKTYNSESTELGYLANPTDSKTTTIKVDPQVFVYNNGHAVKADIEAFLEAVEDGDDVFGTITLINNDIDEEYDAIKLMQATGNYVVSEVNATAKSLEDRNGNNIPIDVDDEDVITKIYNADGVEIAFEDIAAENVITVYENEVGLVAAYVSDVVVTGTVSEEDEIKGSYVIGDGEYKIAYVNGEAEETLKVGDEGKFYVNVEGKIVDKVATSVAGTYAFLFKAMADTDINGETAQLKFLTTDGAWETKNLASKVSVVRYDAEEGTVAEPVTIATADTGKFAPLMTGKVSDKSLAAASDVRARVFQYATNSAGQINKIFIANGGKNSEEIISQDKTTYGDAKAYDVDKNRIGGIYLNNETTVFNVPASFVDDEDAYTVSKVSSLFVDGTPYEIDAYDIENNIPSLVVAYGASANILQGTKLLVVSKVSTISNAAGSEVKKIYGYQDGAEVSGITVEDNELKVYGREDVTPGHEITYDVKPGDVVIFSLNADGEIDKIQVLQTLTDAKAIINNNGNGFVDANTADPNVEAIDYFGFVAKKANGLLYLDESYKFEDFRDALIDLDGEEVALPIGSANGVNVYEINLENQNNTIQVLKGVSYIDAEDRDGKDAHWAYVRVYEGDIVDIVVYRKANVAENYKFTAKYYAEGAAAEAALGFACDPQTVGFVFDKAPKAGDYWFTISNGETTYGIQAAGNGTKTKMGAAFSLGALQFEAWPDGVVGIEAGEWTVNLYEFIDNFNASYAEAGVLATATFKVE